MKRRTSTGNRKPELVAVQMIRTFKQFQIIFSPRPTRERSDK